jgi:hypothetical protein
MEGRPKAILGLFNSYMRWLGHAVRLSGNSIASSWSILVLSAISLAVSIAAWNWLPKEISLITRVAIVGTLTAGCLIWVTGRKEQGSRSNLGAAFLVAFAVFAFQVNVEEQQRRLAAHQEQADRERNFQLTVGLQANLTGIDLSGRYLAGFYLQGKNLSYADLSRTDLRGANLRRADLHGARLEEADLEEQKSLLRIYREPIFIKQSSAD